MQARKTSFTNSLPRRIFAWLPLPVALKSLIKEALGNIQKHNKKSFAEPGTLNNQQQREKSVIALIQQFKPVAVIETGTYLGAGTKFFLTHTKNCPILSCEINPNYVAFCKERFADEPRISLFHGGSVDFLQTLAESRFSDTDHIIFYLDSHWGKDLPLAREIEIIFSRWKNALVIIDDFAVPHDSGYKYDDYGDNHTLNADYLHRVRPDILIFYPKAASSTETGAKRGSCYVCLPSTTASDLLSGLHEIFIRP